MYIIHANERGKNCARPQKQPTKLWRSSIQTENKRHKPDRHCIHCPILQDILCVLYTCVWSVGEIVNWKLLSVSVTNVHEISHWHPDKHTHYTDTHATHWHTLNLHIFYICSHFVNQPKMLHSLYAYVRSSWMTMAINNLLHCKLCSRYIVRMFWTRNT